MNKPTNKMLYTVLRRKTNSKYYEGKHGLNSLSANLSADGNTLFIDLVSWPKDEGSLQNKLDGSPAFAEEPKFTESDVPF